MEHSEQQLADTLTNEPVIFMGCTTTEILTMVTVNVAIAFAMGIVVFIVCFSVSSSLSIILGSIVFFGGGFGLTMLSMGRLQTIKEQRGDNYYKEWIHVFLSESGIATSKVLNESTRFSRGRSL